MALARAQDGSQAKKQAPTKVEVKAPAKEPAAAKKASDPTPPKPKSDKRGVLSFLAAMETKARPLAQKFEQSLRANDYDAAEKLCRQWIADLPESPDGHYNLACVQARRGQGEPALDSLAKAIELGYRDVTHLRRDPDLVSLRGQARFEQLAKDAEKPPATAERFPAKPATIKDGVAWISDGNTALDEKTGLLRPQFESAPPAAADASITTVGGSAGDLLRQWWKERTAAGHHGDLYDNRDGDHSDLARSLFPQLVRLEYSAEAQAARIHWALPQRIFQPGVVLGNASVAWTAGPLWRSMPRMAMSDARGAALLHEQFSRNQLYVYPCHVDHKPGRDGKGGDGGHGDVYFANTPYLIASQGSSGSDQVFLQALALTMASFQPEVKKLLVERQALAPTLQMIFRHSNKQVDKPEDYFTGRAHPPVFRGEELRPEQMVRLAHELTRDDLPPLVSLRVIEEDQPVQGRDFFDPQPSERLFDTPCAIARVMRGTAQRRRMVVSAEGSKLLTSGDAKNTAGRKLTWRWAMLRGDRDAIRIRPLNEAGSRVELSVPWQARRPVEAGSKLETQRIDIGCFVGDGQRWSAPGFVSFYCPDSEERTYDAEGRIESVAYNDHYADPLVVTRKNWHDEYHYADGKLTGWTRHRGAAREEFTAAGRRITKRDESGQAIETAAVRYVAKAAKPGELPEVVQEDVDEKR